MTREQTVKSLLDEYSNALLTGAELSSKVFHVLANTDIDSQLEQLSPEALDWVLWELRDHYAPIVGHDPATYNIIEGVTIDPRRREEYFSDLARRVERLREVELPIVQRWLMDHPLAPRGPFPSSIARGLYTRVKASREVLWNSRPAELGLKQWRVWSEHVGYDILLSLEIELEKSLQRAELGGVGSQEQALAWEGFDRVAHLLGGRQDLTVEERRIVAEARQRRGDRDGSFLP